MASLTGQKIKDTYQSLLKTDDNGLVTSVFKNVTDGSGSSSGLYLKNDGVQVNGSLVVSGSLLYSGSTIDATVSSASYALTASYALSGGSGNEILMHPQTITNDITIPANYNALLMSPVGFSGTVNVGQDSNLTIL